MVTRILAMIVLGICCLLVLLDTGRWPDDHLIVIALFGLGVIAFPWPARVP